MAYPGLVGGGGGSKSVLPSRIGDWERRPRPTGAVKQRGGGGGGGVATHVLHSTPGLVASL